MPNLDDYDKVRSSFRLDVPEFFNFTTDVVDAWADDQHWGRALVAVSADGSVREFTIDEIAHRAARSAAALHAAGLRKGDRVFVQLPQIVEWYDVMLGCFALGLVPMPGTTQLTGPDIAYRIRAADASAVVVDEAGQAKVDGLPAAALDGVIAKFVVRPALPPVSGWIDLAAAAATGAAPVVQTLASDPLLVYFTSGTTAHPKMVQHTHASLGLGHQLTARFWHDLQPGDLHWTVSDFGWAKAGWGKLFGAWHQRAALFLWDAPGKPDYDAMLRRIGQHRITSFCAPPTVYRALVQQPLEEHDWSGLRHCTAAGEPLNPEVISVWRNATGLDIHDGYGQTETVCLIANFPSMPVRPGSMGKPMPGFDVEVVDADGTVVPVGTEGNIAVRTEPRPVGLFTGYWRDQERTDAVFRHGWYYTGDRAVQDEDGYFWFVGRADDVIISAGYRIGPFEVESALLEHDLCVEAAVVGKPDDLRGEIVKAYVVLKPGAVGSAELVSELQNHVKNITAPYKYPREIEFLEELPKTVSGKIRRVDLRARNVPDSRHEEVIQS